MLVVLVVALLVVPTAIAQASGSDEVLEATLLSVAGVLALLFRRSRPSSCSRSSPPPPS